MVYVRENHNRKSKESKMKIIHFSCITFGNIRMYHLPYRQSAMNVVAYLVWYPVPQHVPCQILQIQERKNTNGELYFENQNFGTSYS